jgi:hypothetical protein
MVLINELLAVQIAVIPTKAMHKDHQTQNESEEQKLAPSHAAEHKFVQGIGIELGKEACEWVDGEAIPDKASFIPLATVLQDLAARFMVHVQPCIQHQNEIFKYDFIVLRPALLPKRSRSTIFKFNIAILKRTCAKSRFSNSPSYSFQLFPVGFPNPI